MLKAEIEVLGKLDARCLLVSHFPSMIREKSEVIRELEEIYKTRNKNDTLITVG